ncbi:RNA polymerase sigma factor [Actinomadura namibiensis]|uniref:RNA polymerase sigma-70 factor (ECF subfamily) n=1 Tax=Actinomadura namibiensis TaxID=182080 RepID=A0A7W3LL55_ACTNM|nr:RNA polymerase sigma factor [Actinomadura namibiensis]MBA8950131.1 RNA polymerase sigma-70 factor (ECF subfamily) [Actinomadura namibiensis]
MTAPPGSDTVDDNTVLVRSRREPERFTVIYDRHFPDIYRYVAARLGRDAADDVAAETFYTAFRKRDRFDARRGAVRPWLYGIATRLVGQHRRDESRRYELLSRLSPGDRAVEHEDRAAARVTAQGVRPQLAAALAGLSGEDRDALLLVAVAGLAYEEVAQALEIPSGTVGSRLHRARRKVRQALGGIDPTGIEEKRHA